MANLQPEDAVSRQNLSVLRIIVGSLVGGCTLFFAITLAVRWQGTFAISPTSPLITYLAIGFTLLALVARFIVPSLIVAGHLQRLAAGQAEGANQTETMAQLWQLLTTRTIVAAAILEGATFFTLIAYMLEGTSATLVVAVLLIIGQALYIPTEGGVARWIEDQRALLDNQRHFGRQR